jgi:hypothetical protein
MQFRLRHLFLLMSLLAIALGLVAIRIRQYRQQFVAISELRELGAEVTTVPESGLMSWVVDDAEYVAVRYVTHRNARHWTPQGRAALKKLLKVELIDFSYCNLDAEDLAAIAALPELRCLALDSANLDASG